MSAATECTVAVSSGHMGVQCPASEHLAQLDDEQAIE